MNDICDLIIIGGGPAGYLAAERAGHAGLSVVLFEKRNVGGVCLNEGCVPSKTLLNSAKVLEYAAHGEKYGVTVTGASLDQGAVIKRKNKVVSMLVSGIRGALKASKVTLIEAEAMIKGKEKDGFAVEADGQSYKGRQLLIATGSMPVVPPIPGVKEGLEAGFVLTNREILDLTKIPKSLVVIGGGVIGLEMAAYYNSVGSTVTVIEMLDHIAGATDTEISTMLQKAYEKKGVTFKLGCRVTEVKKDSVVFEQNGKSESVPAKKVLLSIGRRPVTQGFGLENLPLLLERGAIVTDEKGQTNVAGVYASGDVNGKSMLAHTAYRESEVIINNITGKKDIMRYHAIPAVIYTAPEVGSVGETEETAAQKGYDVAVGKVSMLYSGRFVAENEGGDGICKVLFDKKTKRMIGCHMIGSYAGEFIVAAGIMVEKEMTIDEIKEIVFPHPTVCEIIREAVFTVHL